MIAAEEQTLLKALRRIARALELHSRRVNAEIGLTLPQLVVLSAACALGERSTTRAVSDAADISAATVVEILDRLEAKGLIERHRSRADRRVVHTRLTDEGRATLDRAPPLLGARFATALSALAPARRAGLMEGLALLADLADPAPPAGAAADPAPPPGRSRAAPRAGGGRAQPPVSFTASSAT